MAIPLQPAMFPEIEGPSFVRSDEVAKIAADVLDKHGRIGGVARLRSVAEAVEAEEVRILYLLNCKPFDPLKDTQDHDTAGKCVKAPGLWRDVTGYDVAIWIREYFWEQWDRETREAALLHELLHVEVKRDDDMQVTGVAARKHDVEDFVDVVRHYGPLFGEGPALVRAAALFRGEPAPLDPKRPGDGGVTSMTITARGPGLEGRSVTVDAEAAARITANLKKQARKAKRERLAEAHEGPATPAVGDPIVVDGEKLRITAVLTDGYVTARAAFGKGEWSGAAEHLAWDNEAGVWRIEDDEGES